METTARRDLVRRAIVFAAALVLVGAVVHRFYWLGGPWFEVPQTIQDHVWPTRFLSADAILLCRRAAPLLPRGAEVTILAPREAPNYDQTHWLTGIGMLPHQTPVPQKLEGTTRETLPDYVIAIRDPLPHPSYRLVATFPEGFLYEVAP
jgi:hypothetical protein